MQFKHHWQRDIADMMALFKQQVRYHPTVQVSAKEVELRKNLISEECKELLDAIDRNDLVKIADGIADLIVVTLGTANTYGIDTEDVWNEVHQNNLTKASGPEDPVTGKRLKPADWEPPNIEGVLESQGWDPDEGKF